MENAMTEQERAQYLIKYCSHNSAVDFAKSIGTDKTRISKIVHGQLKLSGLYDAIIAAYPDVNPTWLRTGEGYPGDLSAELVKQRYEKIVAEKDALIRTLQRVIEEKL